MLRLAYLLMILIQNQLKQTALSPDKVSSLLPFDMPQAHPLNHLSPEKEYQRLALYAPSFHFSFLLLKKAHRCQAASLHFLNAPDIPAVHLEPSKVLYKSFVPAQKMFLGHLMHISLHALPEFHV